MGTTIAYAIKLSNGTPWICERLQNTAQVTQWVRRYLWAVTVPARRNVSRIKLRSFRRCSRKIVDHTPLRSDIVVVRVYPTH